MIDMESIAIAYILGVIYGVVGTVFFYLFFEWCSNKNKHKTMIYPEAKTNDKRPDGAKVQQPNILFDSSLCCKQCD